MNQSTAEASTRTDASPDAVWKALTTPHELKKFFFGATVESDWKVGSPIRMKGEYDGKSYEDKGEILTFEPGKRLSFSHWSPLSGTPDTPDNYHTVTFELKPEGNGTQVTIIQANLNGQVKPSDIEHKAEYEKNWRAVLDGLKKVCAGPQASGGVVR